MIADSFVFIYFVYNLLIYLSCVESMKGKKITHCFPAVLVIEIDIRNDGNNHPLNSSKKKKKKKTARCIMTLSLGKFSIVLFGFVSTVLCIIDEQLL